VSQQWISKVERGAAGVSLDLVGRLFAGLGKQLRVEVVPLGADMDAEIDQGVAITAAERAADRRRPGLRSSVTIRGCSGC
jgi:hypothetical protein